MLKEMFSYNVLRIDLVHGFIIYVFLFERYTLYQDTNL